MKSQYDIKGVIIRTPLLQFSQINNSTSEETFERPILSNALFIASSVLYQQLQKVKFVEKQDEKFIKSLLKYHTRACTRCTPYGLFAGLHTSPINSSATLVTISSTPKPSLRLDMDYLVNVYHDLCKDETLIEELIYYPNTSLYLVGKKWRYHEFRTLNSRTVFHLVNIDDNVVLSKLIKQSSNGLSHNQCINIITEFGFDKAEATQYLKELITSQVLVNELYPNVSGEEYQTVLFNKLSQFKQYENLPTEVNTILASKESIINKTAKIKEVLASYFTTAINESKFIQVDTLKEPIQSSVNQEIPNQVLEAAEVLNRLSAFDESQSTLAKFKRAYYERYEEAEIPLLELLDTDIGINYKNAVSETEYRSSNKNNMLWDVHSKFRFDLYLKAQKENLTTIAITDEDIKQFKTPNHPLPNSMAFMGELLQDGEVTKIVWGGMSNNATILLGRFGHLDKSIANLCIDIAKKEEALQPDKIFAEIVHISEGRLGNILTRPHYRKFEIPYLAISTLPYEQQIQVNDLMVSVKNDKVILRSKRLNKEVIPRMANAHNYSAMGLPIYHFLSDLQHQGIKGYFAWNWSFLGGEKFLPRVTYRNIILSPAYWNVQSIKLLAIQKSKPEQRHTMFADLIKEYNLYEKVFLSEGDNELLLDLTNQLCIDILLDVAKKYTTVKLTECLFNEDNLLVKDENGNGYTNEIIIPFVKQANNREGIKSVSNKKQTIQARVQRIFEPYSEWVYFKLYTGTKTGDKVLIQQIESITNKLKKEGVIRKWFFIRYTDPKNHLRLRFQLTQTTDFITLNKVIRKELAGLVNKGIIWKVQTDTYQRELERYGHETMDFSESVFHINSQTTLRLLKLIKTDQLQTHRYLVGLLGVINMFDAFGYNIEKRLILIEQSADVFATEFELQQSHMLRDKIKDIYRSNSAFIERLNNGVIPENLNDNFFNAVLTIYKKQKQQLQPLAKNIQQAKNGKPIDELIPSYIHMFVNRIFNSNQRFEEFMIYQILKKYYTSSLAKAKYAKAN
ncbi:MAG: lantibiotic dehydratase [Bacteroidia bacterium]|jgi:thiopeptide-type bacteriocin biosynthesis protein|nr:lantibiotic dehydratase [Bacteroidia bacterium]